MCGLSVCRLSVTQFVSLSLCVYLTCLWLVVISRKCVADKAQQQVQAAQEEAQEAGKEEPTTRGTTDAGPATGAATTGPGPATSAAGEGLI